MWTIIIVAVLLLALFGWAAHSQAQVNHSKAVDRLATIPGYTAQVVQPLDSGGGSLSIDPSSNRFAVTLAGMPPKVYGFSELASVEVETNGRTLTRTNRGSQVAGAAVGAVLLGPFGLLGPVMA